MGTGKPILLTVHSTIDAKRDHDMLKKIICEDGRSLDYNVNPYASRMEFVDPFSSPSESQVHVVRPNHSYLMLH